MTRARATAAATVAAVIAAVAVAISLPGSSSGAFELRVVAETDTTVTFAWEPQPGFGYLFSTDGTVVSRTYNQARSTVKFAKGPETYTVTAIAAGAAATWSTAEPPPQQGSIPAFAVRITPNWVSSQDSASSNYNALWIYPRSPTTPYLSPDSQKQVTRYLLLDPRYKDAQGIAGRDEWWFLIERLWPASYDPAQHGKWGREVNFHNVAGDAGSAENHNGGVGWSFGSGVSALALDWLSGAPSPTISVLTAYRSEGGFDITLPVPERDEWHTYLVHWIAGRTDGTTVRPGAITVWADGNDTPVVDRDNINTVQRAKGPDGNWYVQRWMTLWEGDYTQALPAPAETRLALTRIGNTLAECLADRPERASDNASTMYYRGTGTNVGPPAVTALPDRDPSAARLPASPMG